MKNREKILNTNLYDLLIDMASGAKVRDKYFCILDCFEDEKYHGCIYYSNCSKCIQKWLNAEVKNERWRT